MREIKIPVGSRAYFGRTRCIARLRFTGGNRDDLIEPQNSCGHAVDGDIFVIADVFDPPGIERLDAANLQKRQRELFVGAVLEQQKR